MATTKNAFKIGEIVQLKSGGPKMTVEDPNPPVDFMDSSMVGQIRCQWFAGAKLESGAFPPSSLIKLEDEEKK